MYRISQIWTHLANAEPSLGSEKAARLWSRFYNIFSLTELGRLGDLNDRASLTAEIAEEDKRRATQRINDTQATIEFLEMTVTSYNAFEEELASSYALTTPETAVYLVTFRYIEQHLELPKELNPPMLGNPMMARVAPQLEAKTQTLDATAVAAIKRRTIGAIWKYCSLLFLGLAIVAVFVFRLPLLIIPVALATGIGALIGTIVVWTDPVENLKSQK
jgi:hypothetical protein